MKKGKIILSGAAFIVTAISAFSFKAIQKGRSNLWGSYGVGTSGHVACSFLPTCYKDPVGGSAGACKTINGNAATRLFTDAAVCSVVTAHFTKVID